VQSTQDAAQAREDAQAGNYGKAAAHLGMGTINAGLDWLPAGKVFGAILGGMGARNFPWGKLPIAEQMEKAGRSIDEIWRETGLWRAPDSHWRFEISDKGYRVKPKAGILDDEGYMAAPLYEQHSHPGLQAAYPWLADVLSKIWIDPTRLKGVGRFWHDRGLIELESPRGAELRIVGIHELQHLIDWFEGFARGGSPLEFMNLGIPYQQAKALYERLAGEVSARTAAWRLHLTEKERARRVPERTQETKLGMTRDQQIVRFRDE